jgi:acyl-CoA thioesterase
MDEHTLARAVADAILPNEPLFAAFGIAVESVGPGTARLAMTVRADMVNAQALCHGGIIFLLADSALGIASNSRNQRMVSSTCTIDYLRPGRIGDRLVAIAEEENRTKRTGLYDVRVETAAGERVALFRGRTATIAGTILPATL